MPLAVDEGSLFPSCEPRKTEKKPRKVDHFASAPETTPKIFLKENDLIFRGQERQNQEDLWVVTHIDGPPHLGRCLIFVEKKGNRREKDIFKAGTDLHRVDEVQPPKVERYQLTSSRTAFISRPITKPPPAD